MSFPSLVRCRFFVVLCCCLSTLPGCSGQDGPDRYKLSGKVTVNGQPAPVAMLTFRPDSAKGHSGPGSSGMGRQGLYETAPDKGITAGAHVVEIVVFDGVSTPESMHGKAMTAGPFRTTVTVPEADFEQDFDIPASALR